MSIQQVTMHTALALVLVAGPTHATAAVISAGTPIPVALNTIVVPIEISGAVNVIFWQFDLAYDPTDLQINTGCDPFSGDIYCGFLTGPITEGPFFGSLSPFNVFNPGFITEQPLGQQAGLLFAVNGTFGGSLPGPSGSGVLAYVEFLVIGAGTSPIRVENSTAISAVPEPATLALFFVSTACLTARRFTRHLRRRP